MSCTGEERKKKGGDWVKFRRERRGKKEEKEKENKSQWALTC
jgi:hypothetical protein